MQLIDGYPVYSATDIAGHLGCETLTQLERAVLAGLTTAPVRRDPELDVLVKRGFEHEQRYLAELQSQARQVATIGFDWAVPSNAAALYRAAEDTRLAMAAGADVIYQAAFFDGRWRGHADFLLRVDDSTRPSAFGPFHYEVADTKLARHVKASALLQICFYVDQLTGIQQFEPEFMHVVLGGSSHRTETFRVSDFIAYYRAAKRRFEAAASDPRTAVYPLPSAPDPVEYCDVCRWSENCERQRRDEDHLSLVAGITALQRSQLQARQITTLTDLGRLALPIQPPLERTSPAALARVREQARIQLEGRDSEVPLYETLPVMKDGGLACLPTPSPGDLFLDLEGDAFAFDDGIEYLFGLLDPSRRDSDGSPRYHDYWSRDDSGEFTLSAERRAFERCVDQIMARLDADPTMHVYHYAPYEPTAFKRLMGQYATREDEIDRLLRGGVFVDLLRVVRQGIRASVESYSIKRLEPLYRFNRKVNLRDATSSIVEFETWLQLGEGERPGADHLEKIRLYNRDDVLSTWELRQWLEERRQDLIDGGTEVPRPEPRDGAPSETLNARQARVHKAERRLTEGVPDDPAERNGQEQARWLLAQLLDFHRREEKAVWWNRYRLAEMTDEERIADPDPIAGLEFVSAEGQIKRSVIYRYRFPDQDYKVRTGTSPMDPDSDKTRTYEVIDIDDAAHTIDIKGPNGADMAHLRALIPWDLIGTDALKERLLELGEWVAGNSIEASGRSLAGRQLLLRSLPRFDEQSLGGPLRLPDEQAREAACRLVLQLDHSVLAIQGPPGSGKTRTAAYMICALLEAGKRVGITANSHKVIGNLLQAVYDAADALPMQRPMAVQKGDGPDCIVRQEVQLLRTNQDVRDALDGGDSALAAGTAWLWAARELQDSVDVLFVDEAGQFSLANCMAITGATASLVLLGDPQQLDQPLQGTHPPGAAVSVLGHVLGDRETMPDDRGLFLDTTWRLHPEICRFTSEAFYAGELRSEQTLESQSITSHSGLLSGSGTRLFAILHNDCTVDSDEEAELIAAIASELVDGAATWIDRDQREHRLTYQDILIVAPYNAQVGAIRQRLPQANVGTVDKFQGQEAPISIYSMASSTPEDAPRGMGFLYSRNRLNVATSRARCLAIVVCSPELLGVRARTPVQMRLANALCQFAEIALTAAESSEPERI
jgi:predicted RecB family nuclease